ncbi:MAG: hypothetical protein K5697_11055 [Lachnospiraceae bacterium]|nr:hypothetical protein [Lachnospiraceae bacterium]
MSTVIFISGKQIQLLSASGKGKGAKPKVSYTLRSPEGSIINGIVMDPEAVVPFIKNVFSQNKISRKDVSLVVNSSKIAGKHIELPQMRHGRMLDFIAREFNDVVREDSIPVFSYTTLQENTKSRIRQIYAESVESDFIKDYLALFEEAGVSLSGIYSSEGTMIKMIEQTAGKRSKNFVVQVADDNMLTNVLWVDGKFSYYSGQRCFSEPGTEEYMEECARALSQLTQFMKAHQIESPIQNIYIAGLKGLDIEAYRSLVQGAGIEALVDWYDCGLSAKVKQRFDLTTVLPALAGLLGQEKCNDLLSAYGAIRNRKKVDAFWKKSFVLMGSVAGVMIGLTVWAVLSEKKTEEALEEVKSYNESPQMLMQLGLYEAAAAGIAEGSDRYASYVNVRNAVETFPVFTDAIRDPVEECARGCADVELTSFDAVAGALSFTARADRVQDINRFIASLQEEEIFSTVSYSGYSLNNRDGKWNIHVTCILAEGAGR